MTEFAPSQVGSRRWSGFIVLAAALTVAFTSVATAELAARIRGSGLPAVVDSMGLASLVCVSYVVQLGLLVAVVRLSGSRLTQPGLFERVRLLPIAGVAVLVAVLARFSVAVWELLLNVTAVDIPGKNANLAPLFPPGIAGFALAMLATVVLAPLAEELVFRGVVLGAIEERWGTRAAVWGSAAVFAATHLSPYVIPPIFVFGLLLGEFYVRTRTLWATVLAHAAFNAAATVGFYLARAGGLL
jgi:membrane protease YdiL (CAAX protease family)